MTNLLDAAELGLTSLSAISPYLACKPFTLELLHLKLVGVALDHGRVADAERLLAGSALFARMGCDPDTEGRFLLAPESDLAREPRAALACIMWHYYRCRAVVAGGDPDALAPLLVTVLEGFIPWLAAASAAADSASSKELTADVVSRYATGVASLALHAARAAEAFSSDGPAPVEEIEEIDELEAEAHRVAPDTVRQTVAEATPSRRRRVPATPASRLRAPVDRGSATVDVPDAVDRLLLSSSLRTLASALSITFAPCEAALAEVRRGASPLRSIPHAMRTHALSSNSPRPALLADAQLASQLGRGRGPCYCRRFSAYRRRPRGPQLPWRRQHQRRGWEDASKGSCALARSRI